MWGRPEVGSTKYRRAGLLACDPAGDRVELLVKLPLAQPSLELSLHARPQKEAVLRVLIADALDHHGQMVARDQLRSPTRRCGADFVLSCASIFPMPSKNGPT